MKKKLLCLCLAVSLVLGLFALAPATRAASNMTSSEELIGLIKLFEGFSGTPYKDSDGLYTIGYGTRCPADLVEQYQLTPMTEEEADAELRKEMVTYETAVNQFIDRHGLTYEQKQFDAVVTLVFNCGPSWLNKGNTLVKALSGGATGNELIYAFSIYSMSGGVRSLGHVRRRLAEANVYLNGEYSTRPPENFGYVLYNGNGGTVSTYNVQGYDTTLTAEIIPTATREGYLFMGWSLLTGEPVTILDVNTKGATLYAQWEEDPNYVPPETTLPEEPSVDPSIDPSAPVDPSTDPSVDPSAPVIEIPEGTPIEPVEVTVGGIQINVRIGPGLQFDVIDSAYKGEKFTITALYEDADYLWGEFEGGWIALVNTNYQKPCEHRYNETGRTEPTCTANGVSTYTCVFCGDTYNQTLAAKGHSYGTATCTVAATCKRCGATTGSALGHSFSEATCTEGQVCKICTAAGASALGHNYGTDGICTRCTAKDPDYTITITKVYATVIKTATLTVRVVPDGASCGSLPKGTKVEILEQKMVNGRLWGRCAKGWICLRSYAQLETVTETVKPYQPEQPPVVKPEPETVTKTYATVIKTATLNIRQVPDGTTVGVLYKGDKVEILEQKMVNGRLWGRCEKGWICMRSYVELETVTETITPEPDTTPDITPDIKPDPTPDVQPEPEKPQTVTKTYGTVIKTSSLNIRVVPDGTSVGKLYLGDRVEILEQKMVNGRLWGRCEKGWICMRSYVKLETVTEVVGDTTTQPEQKPEEKPEEKPEDTTITITKVYGTIINTDSQNVRVTPDGAVCGTLKRGEKVEILEQKTVDGRLWGRCEKGWICMRSNVKLETVTETVKEEEKPATVITGKITAACLNVRADAGTNYKVVGQLYKGDTVVILETKVVSGTKWARIDIGWISMQYVA